MFKDDKYAGSVKVGEKGQIVIPKALRDMFGISSGDTLLILGDQERGIAILPNWSLDQFLGQAQKEGGGHE